MSKILANARILRMPMAGIPRYLTELISRMKQEVDLVMPRFLEGGLYGHLWEQLILPSKARNRLLWSPANTGPLTVSNQVVTIHDISPLDHPEWFRRSYAGWYRYLIPKLAKRVRKIITVSNFSKERILLHTGVREDKIEVIPLGISGEFFEIDHHAIDAYRQRVGLPEKYVLTVGSPSPRKNLSTLFVAWEHIYSKIKDFKLVVAGVSRKVFSQSGFTKIPQGVSLLGFVEDRDLPLLYAGASIFVFPSVYEGFGLPPLEAMAAGVPVIASNLASIPEVVGNAALLINPYDPAAIGDAILRIVEDDSLRKDLISSGKEHASKFNWDRTAEQTSIVLKSLL